MQHYFYLNKPVLYLSMESKLLLSLLVLLFACNTKKDEPFTFKPVKNVPLSYINANHINFSNHQDTLYYKQSTFSGHCYLLFPSGDTSFVKSYLNGLEEGLQIKWYDNKQLAEKRRYVDGKKEGLQEAWWPDGKQRFLFTTMQDAFVGELKEWNQAGLLFKDFHYVNGQEEGSEKMWWDNGSVRANYVIRNGKRYGLLGIKICVNAYDSIKRNK